MRQIDMILKLSNARACFEEWSRINLHNDLAPVTHVIIICSMNPVQHESVRTQASSIPPHSISAVHNIPFDCSTIFIQLVSQSSCFFNICRITRKEIDTYLVLGGRMVPGR